MFVMDGSTRSSHGNACFGLDLVKESFLILYYQNYRSEIETVLAHELGHFKKNHVKKDYF